jgi:ACR3 family arsenite efflux pump ArsB
MWKFLLSINKKLFWAIPVMMLLGFLFGKIVNQETVKTLKSLIMPLTFLMVYPMMVTLNIKSLKDGIKNVKLQILTIVINFGIVPFLAYGLGLYFFPDNNYMALGLLLASLLPTSGMTISWTGFAKGNMGAAINMTVIGLTLGALVTPLYVKTLMGAKVDMDMIMVVKQIVYIVFIPMILGYLTRSYFLKKYGQKGFKETWAPRFPSLSTIGVLGIVFVAIALKAQQLSQNPAVIVQILQPLLILYAVNFIVGTLLGRLLFSRGDAIALVYGTVMRNLSIALALSINAFGTQGADAALVIAVSYIIQVQAAAWYVKFTDLFFGPAPAEK